MDFRKIEYFLHVAECLSFTKAAEKICISHQALSKQIRLLEDEIGAALFERTTSKVILTEVGRKMYESFSPAVAEFYDKYSELENYVKIRKSNLDIGYFNALSYPKVVSPVIRYILSRKEELTIRQYAMDVGEVKKMLMNDQLDMIVTVMIREKEWENVQYYSIYKFPMKIIVSENHEWYNKSKVTKEDIDNASMLFYATGTRFFMEHLKVKERIDMKNFDSYMARLYEGKDFGVVDDVYSKREGNFKLLDLPKEYETYADIIVAFKKTHPLADVLKCMAAFSDL